MAKYDDLNEFNKTIQKSKDAIDGFKDSISKFNGSIIWATCGTSDPLQQSWTIQAAPTTYSSAYSVGTAVTVKLNGYFDNNTAAPEPDISDVAIAVRCKNQDDTIISLDHLGEPCPKCNAPITEFEMMRVSFNIK